MEIGKSSVAKKASVITAAFFLVISVLTFFESSAIKKQLSLADKLTPLSPDKYLMILAALIALVTIIYLGKEILSRPRSAGEVSRTKFRDLVAATGIFAAYIASAAWLGYLLSTFLFFFLFLRFVGRYSYPRTFMISILITLCFELIFAIGLQIQLPAGLWDF